MTINHTAVADINPGDTVTITGPHVTITGTVFASGNALRIGHADDGLIVRHGDGEPGFTVSDLGTDIAVTARARVPFYVNADRDPVNGDVITGAPAGHLTGITWFRYRGEWRGVLNGGLRIAGDMPRGMFLLVDGNTGSAPA